jgi:hypothetical protein
MFINKQTVRNFVFCVFSVLILMLSVTLTYYITFYEIENDKNVEVNKRNTNDVCQENNSIFNHIYMKIVLAFFAGGIVSDRIFLKMGVF